MWNMGDNSTWKTANKETSEYWKKEPIVSLGIWFTFETKI